MAFRIVALSVFVLLACASVSHADVSEPFALTIRLHIDPSIETARIADVLKGEAESIWRPYGVELRWAATGARSLDIVSLEAMVVRRFETTRRTGWSTVLGRAFVSSEPLNSRPIRVSLEATRRVLAHRTFSDGAPVSGVVDDRELARALGRVLAHEIGHVLINVAGHDREGLMRANFTPEELARADSESFRLSCASTARLAPRLRGLTGSDGTADQAPCIAGHRADRSRSR